MPDEDSNSRNDETILESGASDLPTLAGPSPVAHSTGPGFLPPNLQFLAQRYDILGELGRGAMGQVYKARDRETGEVVALKLVNPEISSDEQMIERFKRELALARKITHKNVCRVYEFNRIGGIAYTSMEFVEGENLRSVLKRFGTLSPKKGMDLAIQMCSGLKEAHAQGIVHRDLKPENIMIDGKGNLKIMDFGIARSMETMTRATGVVTGTPAYMAPEQALAKPVDYRTDIYALGLIFYEMFTGRRVFEADNAVALALKQLNELPVPPREIEPSVSSSLDRAILKCLEREPVNRFQTIAELETALQTTESLAVPVLPAAAKPSPSPETGQRGRIVAILALLTVLTVASVIAWRARNKEQSTRLKPTPQAQVLAIPQIPAFQSPTIEVPPIPPPMPRAAVKLKQHPGGPATGAAHPQTVTVEGYSANTSGSAAASTASMGSPPVATPDSQPYILVGRYAKPQVVQKAAKKIEAMGLHAIVLPRHNPKTNNDFFAVFSGPFTPNDIDAAMTKLQAAGFPNPTAVKGLGPVKRNANP